MHISKPEINDTLLWSVTSEHLAVGISSLEVVPCCLSWACLRSMHKWCIF